MTTPTKKRERALNIREAALGFNDEVSRTLIELAEGREAQAAAQEAEEAEKPE
jgi:hypothetical protein